MSEFEHDIRKTGFKGELFTDNLTLEKYAHDASMFEIYPRLVAWPKDSEDVELLTKFVAANKSKHPHLSITARAAGTDMSGGAINDSIIMDFSKHFDTVVSVDHEKANVQPGVFFRDFDARTIAHGSL
ncbi:MAG: FAD-binding protein, partial [Patescibacteria group bacterium]